MLNSTPSTREVLTVERFAYTPHGTFGRIVLPADAGFGRGAELFTIEDPPNANRTGASCIPEGEYPCRPRRFNKGGYDAILIDDVPGRSLILFHIANTSHDVRGCVGVASGLGFYRGRWAVTGSRRGFRRLMSVYGGRRFRTRITSFRPEVITEGDDSFRRVLAAAQVHHGPGGAGLILPSEGAPRLA